MTFQSTKPTSLRGTSTFKLVLLGLLTTTGCLTGTFCSISTCLGCGILTFYSLKLTLFLINCLPVTVCIISLLSLLLSMTLYSIKSSCYQVSVNIECVTLYIGVVILWHYHCGDLLFWLVLQQVSLCDLTFL